MAPIDRLICNYDLPYQKVSRSASATGTSQELKVVAVGKNGLRSEAATTNFEWGDDCPRHKSSKTISRKISFQERLLSEVPSQTQKVVKVSKVC